MIMTPGEAKKEQDANYIRLHPDAVQVSVLGVDGEEDSTTVIYGILSVTPRQDTSGQGGRKMIGNNKRLSIAADDAGQFRAGSDNGSKIIIAGKGYTVIKIERQDEGSGYLTTLQLN